MYIYLYIQHADRLHFDTHTNVSKHFYWLDIRVNVNPLLLQLHLVVTPVTATLVSFLSLPCCPDCWRGGGGGGCGFGGSAGFVRGAWRLSAPLCTRGQADRSRRTHKGHPNPENPTQNKQQCSMQLMQIPLLTLLGGYDAPHATQLADRQRDCLIHTIYSLP